MRDKTCMHIIDVPETPDNSGMHADNTCQQAMYETHQEEAIDRSCLEKTAVPRNITNGGPPNDDVLSRTGTVDAARGTAEPDAASEEGKHDVQETLYHEGVPNVADVPGTATNKIFNGNCPEDGQAYHMASMKEPERTAMAAFTSREGRAGGITKCAPMCVRGNFAMLGQLRLLPASDRAACSFYLRSSRDQHTLVPKL
jgi:hypothetical protein